MPLIPASIRNNNPGAMYPGRSARKFGSTGHEILRSKDGTHKIATFPTAIHGAAAQFDLLHRSYCGRSIEKAIRKWCGGFYAGTYLKVLKEKTGLGPADNLTKAMVQDSQIAIPIARAMAWQEAGRDFPLSDEEWASGHQMAFSGAVAPVWSPDNDVPAPKRATRVARIAARVGKAAGAVSTGVAAGAAAVSQISSAPIPAVPKGLSQSVTNLSGWAKAIPFDQWQILILGALVFGLTAVAMKVLGR